MAEEAKEKKRMNPAIQRIVSRVEMRLVSPEEVKTWKKPTKQASEQDLPNQSEQTKPPTP